MGSWAQRASISASDPLSTVVMVCDGQRRSSRVVKGSLDGCEEPPRLPPWRELTKFWTMEETSPVEAALR
jgi:hypothetical protein